MEGFSSMQAQRSTGARLLAAGLACSVAWLSVLWAGSALASNAEPLRVGVLNFGTVNWELDVIRTHALAERENTAFVVIPLASKRATAVALQGGAVDIIVSDWIWVSRQRATGRRYTLVPYSLAVGALFSRPESGIERFADLRGRRVGVAGGPVDKSWLLLRAYARREFGQDLLAEVEPSFAAPPLLNQLMLRGDLPAVLNFWHYGARLKAAGMHQVIAVSEVLPALGVEESIPLLGWVFADEWAETHGERLNGFLRASYAAKRILLDSDAEWERLAPMINAGDRATLIALREAYRTGVPREFGEAEREAARRVFAILAAEGGEDLVGKGKGLTPGTFWRGFQIPAWPR